MKIDTSGIAATAYVGDGTTSLPAKLTVETIEAGTIDRGGVAFVGWPQPVMINVGKVVQAGHIEFGNLSKDPTAPFGDKPVSVAISGDTRQGATLILREDIVKRLGIEPGSQLALRQVDADGRVSETVVAQVPYFDKKRYGDGTDYWRDSAGDLRSRDRAHEVAYKPTVLRVGRAEEDGKIYSEDWVAEFGKKNKFVHQADTQAPAVKPGAITVQLGGGNGEARLVLNGGVEPGTTAVVTNLSSGAKAEYSIEDPQGELLVRGKPGDRLDLTFRDAAGNTTKAGTYVIPMSVMEMMLNR
jgi:hypothetical protein